MLLDRGYDQVAGFVVEAAAATGLRTPQALRAAHGIADDGTPSLDVVRFVLPVCAALVPPAAVARPWPNYPHGFLSPVDDAIVPVWKLSTTRYPPGAELWRIYDDGHQEMVSAYGGAARGWSGAREWRPTSRYFGTRAVWNGIEYAADVAGDSVELTSFTTPQGDGWAQYRDATWSRTVAVGQCDVYELSFDAVLDDAPVRVLEVIGANVRVQLLDDDPEVARRLDAAMIDLGVFELSGIAGSRLTETQLTATHLLAPDA